MGVGFGEDLLSPKTQHLKPNTYAVSVTERVVKSAMARSSGV